MGKVKTIWSCTSCGGQHQKWVGQCSSCHEWNTLQEESEAPPPPSRFTSSLKKESRPLLIKEIPVESLQRVKTTIPEWDRLLGGGTTPGSLNLVGGDPGIGKSTLLLQLSHSFSSQGLTVLYICGEESAEQTSLRAKRLGIDSPSLYLLSETHFSAIRHHIEKLRPDILIADSIQVLYKSDLPSSPGSISQVREITTELMHLAKGLQMTTFLIGHVTKAGEIAGPRVLEHLVDTVLYFEGDKQHPFRMIRVVKNRFGPTDEVAIFSMTEKGLVEIPNPSLLFLQERQLHQIGSAIIPTLEGSRALLIEIQSLIAETAYATPSRRSAGIDPNRLALLLAVLEKRAGYPLQRCDVFVSVVGGIRITEPATDLGLSLSIASSLHNQPLDPHTLFIGEVGLSGEIRPVTRIETRIKEAIHLGFQQCILPKKGIKNLSPALHKKIALLPVDHLQEALSMALPRKREKT